MASTDVVISGETYSLLSEPAESSALVVAEKKKLLGALDLKALVEHLGHVGSFIRIAYNGVGAAGPRFQDLQIEMQQLGYDITKLCDKSAATIASFESTARTVLVELKATYQYLLDGLEEMSIFTLSSLADMAGKMADAALELQRDFESQERKVITTLETTQRTRGEEAIRIEELKRERAKMEHNKQVQAKLIEEHRKLEEEARKEKLYYERKEDKELSEGLLKFGLHLVTAAVTSTCGLWLGKALERAFKFDEDKEDSAKRAEAWKQKSLQKLEIEKEQRKLRHEALQKMADFTFQIQHLDREGNVAEIAVKALHEASGALKYLSVIMLQAANFWQQLQQHCQALATPQVQKEINHVMEVYSERPEVRKKVWESNGFKTKAVSYYAQWVALYSICGKYLQQIQLTQRHLCQHIVENPTYDESRKRLHDLAAEFADVLKAAQAEIAQKDFEADREIKMLKSNSD